MSETSPPPSQPSSQRMIPPPAPPADPTGPLEPPKPTNVGGPQGIDLSAPQRQSPIAAVFLVLKAIRAIGILQLVFAFGFVLSQSQEIVVIAGGVTVLILISLFVAALAWWRYTFSVQEGELRVESGVLSRNRLIVPLDRVQGVSINQKFLHRIVGLVEVTADTAGASMAEFNLAAVKRPVAEALQAAAADQRAATAAAQRAAAAPATMTTGAVDAVAAAFREPVDEIAERVVLKRTPSDLVKLGLTVFPFAGLALIGPLIGVAFELEDQIDIPLPDIEFSAGAWLFWAVPLAAVTAITIGVALNIVQTFLRFWDLTITQTASGLRRNAGLLSKASTATSIPRIQLIRVHQGVASRWVDMREVTLVGVSQINAAAPGAAGVGPIAVPGCSEAQVAELRSIALDGATGANNLDRTVSPAVVLRATRNFTLFVILPLIIGLWFLQPWWPLLALLLIPWRWAVVRRQARLRRWGISSDAVADRRQLIGYYSNETLLRKINSVTIKQSRFERKRDLATVEFTLATGNVTVGMIPLGDAKAVRDRALHVAETDRRAFM